MRGNLIRRAGTRKGRTLAVDAKGLVRADKLRPQIATEARKLREPLQQAPAAPLEGDPAGFRAVDPEPARGSAHGGVAPITAVPPERARELLTRCRRARRAARTAEDTRGRGAAAGRGGCRHAGPARRRPRRSSVGCREDGKHSCIPPSRTVHFEVASGAQGERVKSFCGTLMYRRPFVLSSFPTAPARRTTSSSCWRTPAKQNWIYFPLPDHRPEGENGPPTLTSESVSLRTSSHSFHFIRLCAIHARVSTTAHRIRPRTWKRPRPCCLSCALTGSLVR